MKKVIKCFEAMCIAMVVCATSMFGGMEHVQAATMSKAKQHALYAKTMKQYEYKVKKSFKKNTAGMDLPKKNPRRVMYVFADIDKNGIDELIMKYDDPRYVKTTADNGSLWEQSTTIYTIKNKKVVTVLNNTNIDLNSGRKERVYIYRNRNRLDIYVPVGYDQHVFYKYSNGKINRKSSVIEMSHGYMNGRDMYMYNDRIISANSYKQKEKALTNSGRGYRMKLYKR